MILNDSYPFDSCEYQDLEDMVEAMIDEKYLGAQLPSLPIPSVRFEQRDTKDDHRKVVEFNIPAKRPKPNREITAQSVTSEIQNSITSKDRIEAIYTACATFDHCIEAVHDEEINAGADNALCKHLALLLFKEMSRTNGRKSIEEEGTNVNSSNYMPIKDETSSESPTSSVIEEIANTLSAIEMVLRCSVSSISLSYNKVGKELLPMLMTITEEQLSNNPYSYSNSSDKCLKSCTKILGHFARVGSLTETLANTPNLLSTLTNVISRERSDVPVEAKLNSLWIIANLACNADNMVMMSQYPNLLNTLIDIARHPDKDDELNASSVTEVMELTRSRSISIRAILNLSWSHENKIPLSENNDIVEALLNASQHRSSSWAGTGKGVSGILLQTRRHAVGALRNLAAAPRRIKRQLCRSNSGQFLDILIDIAQNDPDEIVREKVYATLFNLVSADTAKIFASKPSVLDALVSSASQVRNCEDTGGKDSASIALRTLRLLEKSIPEDDDEYCVIKNIILRIDSMTETTDNNSATNVAPV